MSKLNQIIAIEKGVKSRVYGQLTEMNKIIQKPDLFSGVTRVYNRINEEGETFPPETKRVQYTVPDIIKTVSKNLTELMAVTARKDWTNCEAKSDVVVDGFLILSQVPVSYLLFLEKSLTDMRTFIGNLPVLDGNDVWKTDANSGLFVSDTSQTHRTKKIQKPIVLYPSTPEHPAQTQLITEDEIVGYWHSTKTSGAIAKTEKTKLLDKVEKLLNAIKEAREAANGVDEVKSPNVGELVFNYLFT